MKKILHSGQFLDYDGNIIKVSFYKEKHLWISRRSITSPGSGGDFEVEVWSDAGEAIIYERDYDWVELISSGSYRNKDGQTVYKYIFRVASNNGVLIGSARTGTFSVGVETNWNSEVDGNWSDWDTTIFDETITISRQ
jgi:hypothetical protein